MFWRTSSRIFGIVALVLVLGLTQALAQTPPSPAQSKPVDDRISLDFKDVELVDLIQTISELTGRNFLYDETVRGKVTIISPEPMSMDEAYRLFLTVLSTKGYTVVPSGKVLKIVQLKDAKESNLPVLGGTPRRSPGEQFVTRLVPLQFVDAADMATTVLTPLIPKTSSIVAFAPSNTLVITDNASNIDRLVEIIRELDAPSSLDQVEIFTLEYAGAEEVAKILSDIVGGTGGSTISRRRRASANVAAAGNKEASRVIPYPRTNTLIVLATPEDLGTIRNLVARLDEKPVAERSNINVYYLENADAETLAGTLNEILTGIRTQARTAQTTAQAQGQAATAGKAPLSQGPVTISFDKPTNALIINSNPEDFETLKGIISQLDIKRKQVYVEAIILELSMEATQALGVSLQGAVDAGSDSVVFGTSNLNTGAATLGQLAPATGSQVPTLLTQSINGLLLGGLFSPIETTGPDGEIISVPALSVLIDLSRTNSDVNILSAPRLLTSDNEEAEIIVGSNVPIITNRLTDTGSSGLAQSVAIERQDVALTLRFTPQVTEGDLVRLNVFQEITDIATNSVGNVNEVGPTLTKRQLRNTVLAEDGRTVVLGGLIGTNIQKRESKVPLLGDLPLLGWLFRSDRTEERKTNLLVFITPKIIRSNEDLARITTRSREASRALQTEELRTSVPQDAFIAEPLTPTAPVEAPRP